MKGVGGYHDWHYYASPASNLSAFAAPFSVNPYTSSEASSQFVDSAESAETVPPIRFQPYGYSLFSSPVRDSDSTVQFPHLGFPSYSARSNLVEAQPYYASSAVHDHSSNSAAPYHWSSGAPSSDWPSLREANKFPELRTSDQSGRFDQFSEFIDRVKGKQVGVGSNLSAKETNVAGSVGKQRRDQGNQDVKDSSNCEVPQIIDWETCNVAASTNHIHDTSNWCGTIKTMPVEFSGTSVMQSPSMSLETHHEAPLQVVADSGNNHSLNIGSYDKHSRHLDKPSRVDAISSMPETGSVTDLNVADEHVGHNDFYNTKEPSHMPSPEPAGFFNPGPIHLYLGRNELSSSNKAMISDNNVVDYRGSHGLQNPHANMDNLRLKLSAIEDVNFVEKSFEGDDDQCNPSEDSPCWKGASAAHFSHFELSATLSQEYVHKEENSIGSVIQEPQNYLLDAENNMKKSGGNSNGFQMHTGIVYQERSSAGSPRKFSVTKSVPEYCKSGSAVNDGPFQSKSSCDFGLQYVDITKMKENTVRPAKPTDCEFGSSQMGLQLADLNEFITQKQQVLLCTGDVDSGCNVNNCSEYGLSHTTEHVPPLPSSVLDTTTPENSAGKVSTEKLNVQMLLDRMQNLSELLLYHCLNDACELKERDCNVLKNVISNLNTCALKNDEQIAPVQDCLFNQPETSKCARESHEFHQNASIKRPQLTKIGPERSKIEFENPLVAEANLCFRSGKPYRELSDSISPRGDTELTKADNMTKDLKRILSENFHDDDEGAEPQTVLYKNLWLEAEAALCSVYYRARYNQKKIEMDKHSYMEKVMEKQSKSEVIPTLSQSQSSATKMHYPNPDSSAALKFPVLNATNLEELSRMDISTDMNKPNAMIHEGRGQNLDSFIDNYLVPCSDDEAERNGDSSVMARYQVLKARIDQSSTVTTNLEEPLDIADKSSPRMRDNRNQVNLCQDSPIPEKNSTEYETSVLARFHFLKSQDEDSSSISSEGKHLDGYESAGEGSDGMTAGKSLDVHANPVVVHLNSYTAVDKSIPKEFQLDSDDNQETQPPTYYSDGLSDWEHVEKSL